MISAASWISLTVSGEIGIVTSISISSFAKVLAVVLDEMKLLVNVSASFVSLKVSVNSTVAFTVGDVVVVLLLVDDVASSAFLKVLVNSSVVFKVGNVVVVLVLLEVELLSVLVSLSKMKSGVTGVIITSVLSSKGVFVLISVSSTGVGTPEGVGPSVGVSVSNVLSGISVGIVVISSISSNAMPILSVVVELEEEEEEEEV